MAPAWWGVVLSDIDGQAPGEGAGAKMTFSLRGAKLTKTLSTGEVQEGSFAFDMDETTVLEDGTVWAQGKLTTKGITMLCGKSPNEDNAPIYEYDILIINDEQLVLAYPEANSAKAGDTAWFWVFKPE